jgi:hypothetical protein
MAARLKRDVECGVAEVLTTERGNRLDFGVSRSEAAVKALGERLRAARDDGADEWIGADLPASLFGQLDRPRQVDVIAIRA